MCYHLKPPKFVSSHADLMTIIDSMADEEITTKKMEVIEKVDDVSLASFVVFSRLN